MDLRDVPGPDHDYGDLADEYYDADQHPTCRALREASRRLLAQLIDAGPACRGLVCEIGAGRSLMAELFYPAPFRLLLIDSSPAMLAHSSEWYGGVVHPIVARAGELPLKAAVCDLAVASLGDPYNLPTFLPEIARVLRPGGRCLYTTPAFNWTLAFRAGVSVAQFVTRKGAELNLPSYVLPEDLQRKRFESAGLTVDAVLHLDPGQLPERLRAPKLLVDPGGAIVSAYAASKPTI